MLETVARTCHDLPSANKAVEKYLKPHFDARCLQCVECILNSGDMCAGVLKVIDKAIYNSPATFIGRDPSLGALYKQHLSTGTKTLLNVLNHPDRCFSTVECGYNAISYMLNFNQGNVYIPNTFIFSPGLTSDNIDIVWDGKHFTKLSELKRYLSEVM